MSPTRVVVAANRGPVTFERGADGALVGRRGGGGLVTALTGVLARTGGLWLASALSEEDRKIAAEGPIRIEAGPGSSYRVRFLDLDPASYRQYYNGISNGILWFLNHYMWSTPREPVFDDHTRTSWSAYREVNETFAEALAEEDHGRGRRPAFLVQDYHLLLVPGALRRRRPDARITHFLHIPFSGPSYFRILPHFMRNEILAGLLGADVLGFQSHAWSENFLRACRALPGASVDVRRSRVRWQGRRIRTRIYPVGIDTEAVSELAASEEVRTAAARISRLVGDRRLIVRADRLELSKNIIRGFLAFALLLTHHPEWRGRVTFLALLNPSREDLPQYRAYAKECFDVARRINAEFGRRGWKPVEVMVRNDYTTALAAYTLYDVLLVNSTFDGMNLVSKEGPWLNHRDGAMVLSESTGAYSELGRNSIVVNPFDIAQTADALLAALEMPEAKRRRRSAALRRTIMQSQPERWVAQQLSDLGA